MRKRFPAVTAAALLLGAAASLPTSGQTLHIAMTASDIPTTTGIPNNGGEGFRFLGFPAFDGLIDGISPGPTRSPG
jgi:peptide/nickel transport system substrate-binding protein